MSCREKLSISEHVYKEGKPVGCEVTIYKQLVQFIKPEEVEEYLTLNRVPPQIVCPGETNCKVDGGPFSR